MRAAGARFAKRDRRFMTIAYHGVRGSVPTPGPQTMRYGGNTSCVCLEIENRVLVLDAGTGIRSLGAELVGDDREIYVLFTHLHDDHVQGFPFFKPLYEPGRTVHLIHYHPPGHGDPWSPLALFDGQRFPLTAGEIPADFHHVESDGLSFLRRRGFDIERLAVNHPGGAYSYRLHHDGRTYAHVPDNELYPPYDTACSFEELADFCDGADLLCHDAQYQDDDMPAKHGWGHSRVSQTCDLAARAEVDRLLLFHHDPVRTDDDIDALQADARDRLRGSGVECAAAYEGLALNLSAEDQIHLGRMAPSRSS
jgi:phosphoribosyl 1,2-cyclic phosphodiesterase